MMRFLMRKIVCAGLNILWGLVSLPQMAAALRAVRNVRKAQERVLLRIIRDNKDSVYGKEHGFARIRSVQDFISRVPLTDYEVYAPYVKRIMLGEAGVLTGEKVVALEPTSGSVSTSKHIPYTRSLLQQFQNGIAPWIVDLFLYRPALLAGSAYWCITPVRMGQRKVAAAIPVGFKDDSGYFGVLAQRLIGYLRSVPAEVAEIDDMQTFRYVTLLFLLKDKALSLISVWNPTFLKLLVQPLPGWALSLCADLMSGEINPPGALRNDLKKRLARMLGKSPGRARELNRIFEQWQQEGKVADGTRSMFCQIWPCLSLISCWTDGAAARFVPEVRALFPGVEVQPKGLLATECFVSFPTYRAAGAVLSVTSHFFEFLEIDGGATLLAHQLQQGKTYTVVVTTAGGLYRYKLYDIIEVVGFLQQAPVVRFKGKQDCISDLCGEKLHGCHAAEVLKETFALFNIEPQFYLMVPSLGGKEPPAYVLFLQCEQHVPCAALSARIDGQLQENYHYRMCRELGQLQQLRIVMLEGTSDPAGAYMRHCNSQGQRLGQVKLPVLDSRTGWEEVFRNA